MGLRYAEIYRGLAEGTASREAAPPVSAGISRR